MKFIDPKTGQAYYRKTRRRYDQVGQARELTFTCYRRYRFLERDRVRNWFIEALAEARTTEQFDLWAFVIMPEHVHLLIYPKAGDGSVSNILKAIKEPVARRAIEFLKENAPRWLSRLRVVESTRVRYRFWRPGAGYDRNIIEIGTVLMAIEYIHANPVRRRLVQSAVDWEWSSARWYAGMHPVKLETDRSIPAY
jgi:putative transposase